MAVITIDGIRLEVPDGKNVLECALDAGIYIPHLCHHKDLLPLGSCRMCIVEVEGEEKPVPSCKLQAKDGLVISTQTDEVKRLRMLALELLLAGHPEDCSPCPKYGNCELQMLIQYIGPKTGRLKMRTKGFAANDANPLILHDMNRCVLCGRCVRVCKDMRGVNVLHYQKREDLEVYTGTLHEKLLSARPARKYVRPERSATSWPIPKSARKTMWFPAARDVRRTSMYPAISASSTRAITLRPMQPSARRFLSRTPSDISACITARQSASTATSMSRYPSAT